MPNDLAVVVQLEHHGVKQALPARILARYVECHTILPDDLPLEAVLHIPGEDAPLKLGDLVLAAQLVGVARRV